jgi:hypothetical protein
MKPRRIGFKAMASIKPFAKRRARRMLPNLWQGTGKALLL